MVDTLPTSPGVRSQKIVFASNSASYSSPISGSTQTAQRYGGRWQIEMELPPMTRRQSGQWLGVMTRINGVATPVYAGPHNPRPVDFYDAAAHYRLSQSSSLDLDFIAGEYALRWISTPAPLVNGATQTGATLVTDGWGAMDGLNAGDWICFENGTFRELHLVDADCFANASGQMSIPVSPRIRRSPSDNAALTVVDATGEFIAADNNQAFEDFNGQQNTRAMTIKLQEYIR
jgi:hypothetical protein